MFIVEIFVNIIESRIVMLGCFVIWRVVVLGVISRLRMSSVFMICIFFVEIRFMSIVKSLFIRCIGMLWDLVI